MTRRKGKKILITGGTGFLGKHLVQRFLEAGAKNLRVMASRVPEWMKDAGIEPFEGSVTRREDVAKATQGVEVVYHLAGKVSFSKDGAAEMNKIHVEGTRLLCEAARENGVKNFILASSSGTSAITEDGKLVDETYPQPVEILIKWPYYASKYYQEKTALRYFDGKGLRLVILNPSLLLGSGDDRLSSTNVVLDFMARKFPYTPSGGINFVDVKDAAEAFFNALERGRNRERYLLGAVNWTVEEFFERLEILTGVRAPTLKVPKKIAIVGSNVISNIYNALGRSAPFNASEVEMGEYFWYFDSSKAKRELGFTTRDPMETLLDTIKYLKKHFLADEIFSN
ncbi:MAG: NAD-dependent epimerase/dehydratase family protein [Pyrinomonadaceae bacterium]|nr:NAD-dependent epimerase/dehydratase family protein [Pyrinomonadaceae bacterium]MCX7639593.1 NAD-dependent epimerase/dehydratase family protein [Pyrinomonadaceae bacterium]MDW8303986.1 NAD-dependent epimerase/dehydratase family protein [Acidobacteriota bacterium]